MGEFFEEEMGKKRGRFVILQRSRREHYDLVLSEGEETLGMTLWMSIFLLNSPLFQVSLKEKNYQIVQENCGSCRISSAKILDHFIIDNLPL